MEEKRVEALRRRVQEERIASGRGRPSFSKELKQEVVELLNSRGWGHRRVSQALGLSESSIHRWAEKLAPRGKLQARDGAPQFRRASVVSDGATRPAVVTAGAGLCLEFPCGARVTGLTLVQVSELMRGRP